MKGRKKRKGRIEGKSSRSQIFTDEVEEREDDEAGGMGGFGRDGEGNERVSGCPNCHRLVRSGGISLWRRWGATLAFRRSLFFSLAFVLNGCFDL